MIWLPNYHGDGFTGYDGSFEGYGHGIEYGLPNGGGVGSGGNGFRNVATWCLVWHGVVYKCEGGAGPAGHDGRIRSWGTHFDTCFYKPA